MNHFKSTLVACALALCATQAFAGPLDPLAADTTAIMHGTTHFQGFDNQPIPQPTNLVGDVDWAVYAPGTFPAGFAAGGYTPTPGDFVYTYQVHEGHGATGDAAFSNLQVFLTGPADTLNIGDFTGTNTIGLVAGVMSDGPFIFPLASANWPFDFPTIPAGLDVGWLGLFQSQSAYPRSWLGTRRR